MADVSPDRLLKTLEILLRPIARLLIANRISLQSSVEILKQALVRSEEFAPDATNSHISLMTGVHRKDVSRLRQETVLDTRKRISISAVAHVLTMWGRSEMFQTEQGQPLPLPRTARSTEQPGFDTLIRASKVDLPAATVREELLKQGLVAEDADGTLHLLSEVYVPTSGDEALRALEATLADHMRVAIANATTDGAAPKRFDRALRYTHLSEHSVARLEAAARDLASAYLNDLNTMAHALQQADENTSATGRFVTGVYIAPETNTAQSKARDETE